MASSLREKAREMAQQSRALLLLERTQIQFLEPTGELTTD